MQRNIPTRPQLGEQGSSGAPRLLARPSHLTQNNQSIQEITPRQRLGSQSRMSTNLLHQGKSSHPTLNCAQQENVLGTRSRKQSSKVPMKGKSNNGPLTCMPKYAQKPKLSINISNQQKQIGNPSRFDCMNCKDHKTSEPDTLLFQSNNNVQILLEIMQKQRTNKLAAFETLLQEVSCSNKQAYRLFKYLLDTNWEHLKLWLINEKNAKSRRILLQSLSAMINAAIQDSQNTLQENEECKRTAESGNTNSQQQANQAMKRTTMRPPLANITNAISNFNAAPRLNASSSNSLNKMPKFMNQNSTQPGNKQLDDKRCQLNSSFRTIDSAVLLDQDFQIEKTKSYFSKDQLLGLVLSKNLLEVLKIYIEGLSPAVTDSESNKQDRQILTRIIYQVADTILQYYKKQNLYDQYSLKYLQSGVFTVMMQLYSNSDILNISVPEYKEIARSLEFCSTHNNGIQLLYLNKEVVFQILKQFFQPHVDEKSVLYASATVLLDLTANESCIEHIASLMKEHDMFIFIVSKLHQLLDKKPRDSQFQKLRDLFIGIVLNLTCNIESSALILYMIQHANIINVLKKVLVDARHDWPTNGAALAILQYSHLSMQETEIFEYLSAENIRETLQEFLDECKSKEAKKHMYENLTIIEICSRKVSSISAILQAQVYAACA